MHKRIFACFASATLLALVYCNALAADSQAQDSASLEHINSVQALNYAAMSVYRVEKIPSKVTVAEEYAGIINNIAFGNIEDDPALKRLIEGMMDAYTEERLGEKDRDLLRRQYEVQVNQAFLKVKPLNHIRAEVAVSNAERMMMAMRADGFMGKLIAGASAAGGAFMEYNLALQENERMAMQAQSEEKEFMQQRMTQEWQLDKEKIRRFNGLQKDLINAAWSLLRRYNLPDKYRLTDENITAYFKFIKEKDPATAVRQAKRLEEGLAGYPPFWLYYGMAAQRNGDLRLARECYENCEKFAGTMLRKNHFLAAMARYKLFVLGASEKDEARRLLGLIEKHSAADDWNNITFAALQWYQLGNRAKADELLQQNIDDKFDVVLHTELRRQLAAGKLNLAAVRGVVTRDFNDQSNLEMLAMAGDANAQYNLGLCYEFGKGMAKDMAQAVTWYRKAAEQGNASAQTNLGACYYNGQGVTKDLAQAVTWFRKAAEQGDASAQFNLGLCYADGIGVARDMAQAVTWYRKAAEQGKASAQHNLGTCYDIGEGVAKDMAQALTWYRKAAEQGYALAQARLGTCYAIGEGVAKDMTQALTWLRKAAEQGHIGAQFNLGVSYENGDGVTKDIAKAVEWYKKAAAQGDEDAQKALQRLGR